MNDQKFRDMRRCATAAAWVLMLGLAGCKPEPDATVTAPSTATPATAPAAVAKPSTVEPFAWPASLRPFGDGYPQPGDPCRRLGESSAVSNWLDHTRTLVGCPGPADSPQARALVREHNGMVAEEVDGVTLISVPAEKAAP